MIKFQQAMELTSLNKIVFRKMTVPAMSILSKSVLPVGLISFLFGNESIPLER
jgi:hypothetical protein